jgi:hypothetical protein
MLTGDAACPVGYGSLWDMLNFHAADFMHLMQILFDSELEVGRTSGPLPSGMIDTNMTAAEVIRERAEELHLPVTKGAAVYIEVSKTSRELSAAYLTVKRTMHQELMNRVFVEPEPKYKQYYEQTFLFGQNVFDAFPSANDDIYEAGMCLALERATGCVMHLNRALECGLPICGRYRRCLTTARRQRESAPQTSSFTLRQRPTLTDYAVRGVIPQCTQRRPTRRSEPKKSYKP